MFFSAALGANWPPPPPAWRERPGFWVQSQYARLQPGGLDQRFDQGLALFRLRLQSGGAGAALLRKILLCQKLGRTAGRWRWAFCLMRDVRDQRFDLVFFFLQILSGNGAGGQVVGQLGLHGGDHALVKGLLNKVSPDGGIQHVVQRPQGPLGAAAVPQNGEHSQQHHSQHTHIYGRRDANRVQSGRHVSSPPRYSRCRRPFLKTGAWRERLQPCPASA